MTYGTVNPLPIYLIASNIMPSLVSVDFVHTQRCLHYGLLLFRPSISTEMSTFDEITVIPIKASNLVSSKCIIKHTFCLFVPDYVRLMLSYINRYSEIETVCIPPYSMCDFNDAS